MERAASINRFIEIGMALNALNNFNGAIEILSALHSSAISRLKVNQRASARNVCVCVCVCVFVCVATHAAQDTWALVPLKTMTMLEELGTCLVLTSPASVKCDALTRVSADMLMNTDGNFRYYRMLLEKSKPPIVPYMGVWRQMRCVLLQCVTFCLGLLLTDLTFMDDANLTELGKGDAGQKLLNFSKLHMLAG